jgi:hypothetical protein
VKKRTTARCSIGMPNVCGQFFDIHDIRCQAMIEICFSFEYPLLTVGWSLVCSYLNLVPDLLISQATHRNGVHPEIWCRLEESQQLTAKLNVDLIFSGEGLLVLDSRPKGCKMTRQYFCDGPETNCAERITRHTHGDESLSTVPYIISPPFYDQQPTLSCVRPFTTPITLPLKNRCLVNLPFDFQSFLSLMIKKPLLSKSCFIVHRRELCEGDRTRSSSTVRVNVRASRYAIPDS